MSNFTRDNSKIVSDIGSGMIDIYRGTFRDSLAYFKDCDSLYAARDMQDAIEMEAKGNKVILVTNRYNETLRAYPVIDGKLRLDGMWSDAFVHSCNGIVNNGYSHPIRLMDRFE